jgi:hypothetical protein
VRDCHETAPLRGSPRASAARNPRGGWAGSGAWEVLPMSRRGSRAQA